MSRKPAAAVSAARILAALLLAAVLLATGPVPALGHALGQTFQLPVPLWLYLSGAAAAVGASFVVTAAVARTTGGEPRYPVLAVPEVAHPFRILLRVIGLVWWLGAIGVGLIVGDISPLPALLLWIGIWVGLPIAAVLFGNPWPSLSPLRSLFALAELGARVLGFDRLDLGVRYPSVLARWPAVVLLFGALWCELVLPGATAPTTIAWLLIGYSALTLLGMTLFGRVGWLRNVELFDVLFGWFGRVGPIGRRVVFPDVCVGCEERCDPDRCVDCPECATAAADGERRVELRPWFAGLTEVRRSGASDAAFIVLALAGVSYDGLQETVVWGTILNLVFQPVAQVVGPALTVQVVNTGGLLATWLGFLAVLVLAVSMARRLAENNTRTPLADNLGAYAATLLPIAGGYLLAHYLTLVIQGAAWLPELVLNPLSTVAPSVDWIPIAVVWYLSVGAIVLGHIAAVVLGHRIAVREAPERSVPAGVPMVALMIGYTVLSLWIIAQPIVIEPGGAVSAIVR